MIGRKNFLFSNSINGAKASGAAYSIIESAKMNRLKPYEYIEYILTRMAGKKLTEDLLEEIMTMVKSITKNIIQGQKGIVICSFCAIEKTGCFYLNGWHPVHFISCLLFDAYPIFYGIHYITLKKSPLYS